MNFADACRAEPGKAVRLDRIDPDFAGNRGLHDKAASLTEHAIARIDHLQYRLYAANNASLLIVLQGLDAAGKDGTIRHLFSGVNPQGTRVHCFKEPSAVEASHDFLWRAHQAAPARGEVTIFNRSHYEDVLIVRVHKLVSRAVWSRRFEMINAFEDMLTRGGTRILKFFLHISPEEQLQRFRQRLDDPLRQWKISESDYSERTLWPKYIEAYEEVFARTSTKHAPWYIIPANHKWFRNLAISTIVAESIEAMKLELPPARVDLDDIRRRFHRAKAQEPDIMRAARRR